MPIAYVFTLLNFTEKGRIKMKKKVLSLFLCLLTIVSVVPMGTISASAAANKTKAEANSWINSRVGKNVTNVDGAAGYQCVDLVLEYYQFLGVSGGGGNACDYSSNTLPAGFTRIQDYYGFVPEPGDIAVWDVGNGEYKNYGHVGLVISADLNNIRIAEVWGGGGSDPLIRANTMPYNSSGWYEHFWGVIRPKFADTPSNVPTTGIALNATQFTMGVGESRTITATVSPSNATNKNVTWSSNAPEIATVSNGKITGVSAGACTITAKAANGQTASCLVVVFPKDAGASSFMSYNEHYYEVYDYATSWHDAKAFCESLGGHLVTITSAQENESVWELAQKGGKSRYFIGASDEKTEGTFEWVTGEPFTYENLGENEPDPKYAAGEDYIFMDKTNGLWGDIIDYQANPNVTGFICEYDAPKLTANAVTIIDGKVYELYDRNYAIGAADELATAKGGHLLSLTSAEKQTAVGNWVKVNSKAPYIALGATDAETEGIWKWTNGEKWGYTAWLDGEPNNSQGIEDNAIWFVNSGLWNDTVANKTAAFIIEYTLDEWLKQGNSLSDIILDKLPEGADPNDYEIVTEYRSRDKSTTTSTAASMDGWTKYDSKTTYGTWSNVKSTATKPTASDTLQITGTWTQYHYFHYVNYYDGCYNIDSIPYGTNKGKHTIERNSPMSAVSLQDQGGKQAYGSQTCSCGFNYWFLSGTTLFYNYQTRTKTTTNYFYKWSDWTAWGKTPIAETDTREVETRTVYRLKENVQTPATVSSISIQSKPTKTVYTVGETFNASGLSVKVNMSDGTSKTVTSGFTVSSPDMTTAGTKNVTVTYQGKTTTFTITVNNVNTNSPSIKIDAGKAVCGQQIKIPVIVEKTELGTLTIDISYDSTKIKIASIDEIPFDMFDTNTKTAGKIRITARFLFRFGRHM